MTTLEKGGYYAPSIAGAYDGNSSPLLPGIDGDGFARMITERVCVEDHVGKEDPSGPARVDQWLHAEKHYATEQAQGSNYVMYRHDPREVHRRMINLIVDACVERARDVFRSWGNANEPPRILNYGPESANRWLKILASYLPASLGQPGQGTPLANTTVPLGSLMIHGAIGLQDELMVPPHYQGLLTRAGNAGYSLLWKLKGEQQLFKLMQKDRLTGVDTYQGDIPLVCSDQQNLRASLQRYYWTRLKACLAGTPFVS